MAYTFDEAKKITKVETVLRNDESNIGLIKFYNEEELLVSVGVDEEAFKLLLVRVEVFEIAEDEQLIGCEANCCIFNDCFYTGSVCRGITWLKWKIEPK